MAIYTKHLTIGFDEALHRIHDGILNSSMSASFEDGSDITVNNVRVATRVYERYSSFGGNRVSLSVTLAGGDGDVYLTGITSGGSQALFFKINTVGENAFLAKLEELFEE